MPAEAAASLSATYLFRRHAREYTTIIHAMIFDDICYATSLMLRLQMPAFRHCFRHAAIDYAARCCYYAMPPRASKMFKRCRYFDVVCARACALLLPTRARDVCAPRARYARCCVMRAMSTCTRLRQRIRFRHVSPLLMP